MSDLEAQRPAWQRPPFEKGHTLSLVHGASSDRTIEARAAHVHEQITEVAPWLSEPHYAPAVWRYLRAAAREALMDEHIATVTATKGAGAVPSRMWEQVTAAARLAAKLGSDLGLDPIGDARLRATAATAEVSTITLQDLMAQGQRARLDAEARFAADATATPSVSPGEVTETIGAAITHPDDSTPHDATQRSTPTTRTDTTEHDRSDHQ